ncbi:hypothetical protein ACN6KF_005524 [Labrys sp. La1]|uniref:hypothetical protein n=1 Tax=Labrys sp. La1 TaxID=3404917 RepID=UPI003EC0CC1B
MFQATIDAADGEAYNQSNCHLAAQLILAQPGVIATFWCEEEQFKVSSGLALVEGLGKPCPRINSTTIARVDGLGIVRLRTVFQT